jgi:hypothetical protein
MFGISSFHFTTNLLEIGEGITKKQEFQGRFVKIYGLFSKKVVTRLKNLSTFSQINAHLLANKCACNRKLIGAF